MDTENVVYTYNGMLLSLKKERNADTHHDMGEPWRQAKSVKISQLQKKK